MLKVLKWLLGIVGFAGIGVAIYFLVKLWADLNVFMGAANQGRSTNLYESPITTILITCGIAAAGAMLLGLALGMPTRTASGIRSDALEEAAARREAEIRGRVRGQADRPVAADEPDPAPAEPPADVAPRQES